MSNKMTKQQFIGHMFCDMRYKQLKDMIRYRSVETVLHLYDLHKQIKSVRYTDLQKTFQERFDKENDK